MAKNLVIVESPGKVGKIQGFLDKKDYKVVASVGHIRDLASGSKGVDKKNGYLPNYVVTSDKKDVIKGLEKLSKESEIIWLATDDDREGEAIAWHLYETLGLKADNTRRIVFHEITKRAIEEAIANPGEINMDLVNAQQARRVLDRLVGFDLSPLLWTKVQKGLSAGRVQSVAVRIIVEKEKEIKSFKTDSDFKVTAIFSREGSNFKAILNKRFKKKEDARNFIDKCVGAEFSVENLEKKPGKKKPPAPFITSSLQQTASSRLGFAVDRTMKAAQKLYEEGLITYMRTDSVVLSEDFIKAAEKEITSKYGKEYSNPRRFKGKAKGAQEAHEAIRPTYPENQNGGTGSDAQKLYDLIWKRTMASQMSDAEVEKTVVTVGTSNAKEKFIAKGEIVTFDGFLKAYSADVVNNDDDDDEGGEGGMLPDLKKGNNLNSEEIVAFQSFKKPPPRYNEASLVKKLEDLGIGRPSTYASIISTVQKRGYVEKRNTPAQERKIETITLVKGGISETSKVENFGAVKNRMAPTDIGIVVNDFLVEHFEKVMDYGFTASVEGDFDIIAQGNKIWTEMISEFYVPFHDRVKEAAKGERKAGERLLGEDPDTGKPISARIGRFGPMIQMGTKDDEEKPKFAKLNDDQSIETITLEEALKLLAWPRSLGNHKGDEVIASIGKFGPYVKYKGEFCSIGEEDPATITLKRAVELIDEKAKAKKSRVIKEFKSKDISVLNGKYGPYISQKKKNYKIPDFHEASKLTLKDCEEIIKNSKKRKKK